MPSTSFDFSGFFVGLTQTLIGYPLDTLKTWSQSQNLQVKQQLKHKLTVRNLYRGMSAPIATSTGLNTLFFGITHYLHDNSQFGLNYHTSGFIAGISIAPIINPIELYKVRRQQTLAPLYKNPFSIRSMTYGLNTTVLREGIGCGLYFGTFYKIKEMTDVPLVSGGTAGLVSWMATYPLDTIKTRVHSGIEQPKNVFQLLSLQNLRRMTPWSNEQMWRGFRYCAIRSIVVNSIGLEIFHKIRYYDF
jgi:solute carrier family 25 (mitochondrial carnitine/acylcarnitine transporter), member 20/29